MKQKRLFREMYAFQIMAIPWKKGHEPDIYQLMPLPGDPKLPSNLIEISDEEMARRKYKVKKAYKAKMSKEFEDLIRTHYQPSWGPHPDELVKQKDKTPDGSPA